MYGRMKMKMNKSEIDKLADSMAIITIESVITEYETAIKTIKQGITLTLPKNYGIGVVQFTSGFDTAKRTIIDYLEVNYPRLKPRAS